MLQKKRQDSDCIRAAAHTLLVMIFIGVGCKSIRCEAQLPAPLDFDQDGETDILTTAVNGSDLRWAANGSSSAVREVDVVFGTSTDTAAPACWLSAFEPTIGVVRLSNNGKTLAWRALKSDGTISARNFGRPNDLTISGGDFDGNGIADAAVVRVSRGSLEWEIAHDHLADAPGKRRRIRFGIAGDRVFILQGDGEGDRIGVFGKRRGNKAVAVVRSVISKKQATIRGLPRSLTQGERPRPFTVVGPDGEGVLAFVLADRSDSTILGYSLTGERLSRLVIPGTGAVITGDFIVDEPGEEVAVQTLTNLSLINPASGAKEFRASVSGTVIGPKNFVVVKGLATPTPAPTATPASTATPAPTPTATPTP